MVIFFVENHIFPFRVKRKNLELETPAPSRGREEVRSTLQKFQVQGPTFGSRGLVGVFKARREERIGATCTLRGARPDASAHRAP